MLSSDNPDRDDRLLGFERAWCHWRTHWLTIVAAITVKYRAVRHAADHSVPWQRLASAGHESGISISLLVWMTCMRSIWTSWTDRKLQQINDWLDDWINDWVGGPPQVNECLGNTECVSGTVRFKYIFKHIFCLENMLISSVRWILEKKSIEKQNNLVLAVFFRESTTPLLKLQILMANKKMKL